MRTDDTKAMEQAVTLALGLAHEGLRRGVPFAPTLFAYAPARGQILSLMLQHPDGHQVDLEKATSLMSAATVVLAAPLCVSLHCLNGVASDNLTIERVRKMNKRTALEEFGQLTEFVLLILETREKTQFRLYRVVRFDNRTFASLSEILFDEGDPYKIGGWLSHGVLLPPNPPEDIVQCARSYLASNGANFGE